jgi:hypothetical protein
VDLTEEMLRFRWSCCCLSPLTMFSKLIFLALSCLYLSTRLFLHLFPQNPNFVTALDFKCLFQHQKTVLPFRFSPFPSSKPSSNRSTMVVHHPIHASERGMGRPTMLRPEVTTASPTTSSSSSDGTVAWGPAGLSWFHQCFINVDYPLVNEQFAIENCHI